jgi:hypothetical protein
VSAVLRVCHTADTAVAQLNLLLSLMRGAI